MSEIRLCGYESATYLDDVYLQANTRVDCQNNVRETAEYSMSLGFVIHPAKSVLDPATSICHIGFLLNLTTMEICLTPDKAKAVTIFCNKIAASINLKIREVARCIGLLVSCFPAVPHGKLFYQQIEMDKIKALTQARGNFEKTMALSAGALTQLGWWSSQLPTQRRQLTLPPVSKILLSDASDNGWGAVVQDTALTAGGLFTENKKQLHINVKEMLAILFSPKSFCKLDHYTHIKVMTDNMTAVSYVREMGGTHSAACNDVACKIWEWAKEKNIWLTIAHVPGVENVDADRESRHFHKETEWQLRPTVFNHIIRHM